MPAPLIRSFARVVPMIYAYNTPEIARHRGWTKIGYTEKQSVGQRIAQQTHTADVLYTLAWQDNALFKDGSGEYFTDREFHAFLETRARVERTPGTEWFHVDGLASRQLFDAFAARQTVPDGAPHLPYTLREEQAQAVAMTKAYFDGGGTEFLWNAKPRFGKTLAAYDLVRQMGFAKVLIVTNRPSIANSWADDFGTYIGWQAPLRFVSETDALKGKPGVMTRDEYTAAMLAAGDDPDGMVAFESLQGLKGSVYFGGKFDKLKWMQELEFDLLIVDEAQEGVDTLRTDRAFRLISRKHTLYLSGTPFKQLAGEQFAQEQIFNWSYADEQAAKAAWQGDDRNPYEVLPRLALFTYRLSDMIRERVEKGLDLSGEDGAAEYAFDLNEFFATDDAGRFLHEEKIKKFLHALTVQEKYPFSTPQLRGELRHTLWLLDRVASARALARLLQADPVFGEYHIVLAAGDGRLDDGEAAEKAFDKVKQAIATHEKTITLSVGQLTVGVTVPEWSGVLMLCNLKSPSAYMQAAFRAQNPCIVTQNGQRLRKQTAYIFDFDPARTLVIFDEFANNLRADTAAGRGTGEDRKENIRRLLNFFPVLGEDDEGKMVELDAAAVLTIPRKLKSEEVVRRGFMSNFLFRNIANVFGAPAVVREIMEKLAPAQEENRRPDRGALDGMDRVTVDENGEAAVPNEIVIGKAQDLFGPKIYETLTDEVAGSLADVVGLTGEDAAAVDRGLQDLAGTVKDRLTQVVLVPLAGEYGMKKGAQERLERQIARDVEADFTQMREEYARQARIAKAELERGQREAQTAGEAQQAEAAYGAAMETALQTLVDAARETVAQTIQNKPQELVARLEQHKAEQEKRTMEEEVRAHLRGFARTIPSFIMAYGDGKLRLANFDDYTEDDVFLEVTGITEAEFRFLRDGGDYTDPETGAVQHFDGHLFDEVVFNDSVAEFWKKKEQLANYFDETATEDIFDYIPPQKTNQIFTPRWVVEKMADLLEENDPGCFDDPTKTFADLYMKSGLYITEVVKRLYRSPAVKAAYPDDGERIRHILREQVYGIAPTRIIYLIATNYILGFDPALKAETHNFVQADAAKAAREGTLRQLVEENFGAGKE